MRGRGELIAANGGKRRAVLYTLFTPMPGGKKLSPDSVRTEERDPILVGNYQLQLDDRTLKSVYILSGPKLPVTNEWKYLIEVEDDS